MSKASRQNKGASLLPLLILFIIIVVALVIAYVAYSIAQEVAVKTKGKMEKKNITLSRDGMKVGVKEVKQEDYEGSQQNLLVKMWSNASFKGRFDSWGTPTASTTTTPPAGTPGVGTEKRKTFSRAASSQQNVKRS